jgi:hypothetical protein
VESELTRAAASELHRCVHEPGGERRGAGSTLRDQPQDRVQVDLPVPRRLRVDGSLAAPSLEPARRAAGDRGRHRRGAKGKPRWGPRKLRASLQRGNPTAELPSVATFALIFKRNGLVVPHAPHSEARHRHATVRHEACATARLRALSSRVQRAPASRSARQLRAGRFLRTLGTPAPRTELGQGLHVSRRLRARPRAQRPEHCIGTAEAP